MSLFKLSRTMLLCSTLTVTTILAQPVRFVDTMFTVTTQQNVTYRITKDYLGLSDTLKMDLYLPSGDTLKTRPAVVVLYGGSFLYGAKTDAYIVNYCTNFSKRGYVAIAIDYRLGVNFLNISQSYPAAIYRAVQDSRAAVRFLRKNAAEYKIDLNRIYGCGYSAGAITVLHHAYLDQDQANGPFDSTGLGALDNGDYIEQSSQLNAVVNLSGFIGDSSWICKTNVPLISFHGVNDTVIPYEIGYPLKLTALPKVFGGAVIDRVAQRNGLVHLLKTFPDKGHMYDESMIVDVMTNTLAFLYPLVSTPLAVHDNIDRNRIAYVNVARNYGEFDLRGRQIQRGKSAQLLLNVNGILSHKVINTRSK